MDGLDFSGGIELLTVLLKDYCCPPTRCIENEDPLDDINPVPASLPVLLIEATLSPSISFLAFRQLLLLHL